MYSSPRSFTNLPWCYCEELGFSFLFSHGIIHNSALLLVMYIHNNNVIIDLNIISLTKGNNFVLHFLMSLAFHFMIGTYSVLKNILLINKLTTNYVTLQFLGAVCSVGVREFLEFQLFLKF